MNVNRTDTVGGDGIMTRGPIPRYTTFHFSQSNPSGPGQGSVPSLLRRVADSIESLGPDVVVEDITFSSEPTGEERDLSMTVYYHDA